MLSSAVKCLSGQETIKKGGNKERISSPNKGLADQVADHAPRASAAQP